MTTIGLENVAKLMAERGRRDAELRDAHQEAVRIFLAFKSLDSPCTCDPGYIAEGYRHWATCPLSNFTREELEGLGVTT